MSFNLTYEIVCAQTRVHLFVDKFVKARVEFENRSAGKKRRWAHYHENRKPDYWTWEDVQHAKNLFLTQVLHAQNANANITHHKLTEEQQ
jgi:hypothetical protein